MNPDRYITDEAVQAAKAYAGTNATKAYLRGLLRAALPHIEPLIRADVLQEVKRRIAPCEDPSDEVERMIAEAVDE